MTRRQAILALIAGGVIAYAGTTVDFSGAAAQDLATTRQLCQASHDRRYPQTGGPIGTDGGPAAGEWDRFQSIIDDARGACMDFREARRDYVKNPETEHTLTGLRTLRADCLASEAQIDAARQLLAEDEEACRVAATALACANDMDYPGECPTDGGS